MSLIPGRSAPVPNVPEGDSPYTSPPSPSTPEGVISPESLLPKVPDAGHDSMTVPLPLSPVSPVESHYPTDAQSGNGKDGPAFDRSHPFTKGRWVTGFLSCLLSVPNYAFLAAHTWRQPPPSVRNAGVSDGPLYSSIRVKCTHLAHLTLLQDDWSSLGVEVLTGLSPEFAAYLQLNLSDDPLSMTITDVQPHLLKANTSKSDPDNPT